MSLAFEFGWLWWLALPVVAVVLFAFARRHAATRPRPQWLTLLVLRCLVLAVLVFLLARPVWVTTSRLDEDRRRVALLIDESESMSLEDIPGSRYRSAVRFAREQLLPALERAELEVDAYLFGETVRPATGQEIVESTVAARQTNLAGAIAQVASSSSVAPRAIIALTDGNATDPHENARGVSALLDRQVPFLAVGFGSDQGPRFLSLEEILAPSRVPPRQQFRLSARLQASGSGEFPSCELLLLKNGQLLDRKPLAGSQDARIWQETFLVQEDEPGRHEYRVQLLVPEDPLLRLRRSESQVSVDVTEEEHWHILFVQGGLTWDFKFIQLAVDRDPALRISALSRTASDSRFFQKVDNDAVLSAGFPSSLEQMAPFRVVVLANIRPADLRPSQQELLVRFCGESGGGVLMIGGSETFNVAWRDSPLEQLLPVRFAMGRRLGSASPFQPRLTPEAVRHPVFQLSGQGNPAAVWRDVPQFTEYAEVEGIKLGAEVWAEHPSPPSRRDRAPLIAIQRFGQGRSAAICVPNLWRWRLDQDSDPRHYDRFWQQFFRFLGGGNQDPVLIHLADQELTVDRQLTAVLEMRAGDVAAGSDGNAGSTRSARRLEFQVATLEDEVLSRRSVGLSAGGMAEVPFRIQQPGTYQLRVVDEGGELQGTRVVDLKQIDLEMASPGRNLSALRQWAGISGGMALAAEDCREPRELIEFIQGESSVDRPPATRREPLGIHWLTLLLLLGLLAADWSLRKHWRWT